MQDKYVGDIGDFGKYALLQSLAKRDVPLGIVWYLTNDAGSKGDGAFIQYLSSPSEAGGLGSCDAQLFSVLCKIVHRHDRRVARIKELAIFPQTTEFFEERLDFKDVPAQDRCDRRKRWLQSALRHVEGAALVFLDPDNGLSLNERIRCRKNGPKYVFLDETLQFLSRGQSLIIYCHQDRRKGGLAEQVGNPCESTLLCQVASGCAICWPKGLENSGEGVSAPAVIFGLKDVYNIGVGLHIERDHGHNRIDAP